MSDVIELAFSAAHMIALVACQQQTLSLVFAGCRQRCLGGCSAATQSSKTPCTHNMHQRKNRFLPNLQLKPWLHCCMTQAVDPCAGDLDKLLGSRLKSVRPAAVVRQAQEADSPVSALRGQLRRVKLEEGVEPSSPLPSSPQDRRRGNITGASPSQVACT